MLGELWSSVKGFRFCSGIWAYFTARDRNRTERDLNKQHDEGTRSIAKEIENGGVVWETQPGRSRFIYRPVPVSADSPRASSGASWRGSRIPRHGL